jgi:hypothetical protein
MAKSRNPGTLAIKMIGTWSLISRIDTGADGSVRTDPALGSDPLAILTYTQDRFSAQFIRRDRSTTAAELESGSGQNNTRAVGG